MSIQAISFLPPSQTSVETSTAAPARKADAAVVDKPTAQAANPEQIKTAVASVRAFIEPINSNLEFSMTDDTHQVIIKVVDKATKELIRQIPSEEMLAIAKALDNITGLFIKQQA